MQLGKKCGAISLPVRKEKYHFLREREKTLSERANEHSNMQIDISRCSSATASNANEEERKVMSKMGLIE